MKIIKWGILGTGSIAKAFADALKETEGELVAVASSTELRAKEFVHHMIASQLKVITI